MEDDSNNLVDSDSNLFYIYNKKRVGLSNQELISLRKYLFSNGPEPRWVPDFLLDKEWLAEYFDEELQGA